MWRLLRRCFPDAHFRRQVPLRDFVADFASHRLKLVIEVDGGQHSAGADRKRDTLIEAEGYRVLRFWNHDVLGNADGVMTVLATYCGDSTPTQPSPIEGEGLAARADSWRD
jgi:very-short-patch-repair endonuclease